MEKPKVFLFKEGVIYDDKIVEALNNNDEKVITELISNGDLIILN
jgi:hypothetical protein